MNIDPACRPANLAMYKVLRIAIREGGKTVGAGVVAEIIQQLRSLYTGLPAWPAGVTAKRPTQPRYGVAYIR